MEKQLRRLTAAVVVLSIAVLANFIAIGYLGRAVRQPQPLNPSPLVAESVPAYAEKLLLDQDLIRLAGSSKFVKASEEDRKEQLRDWCLANAGQRFDAMSSADQDQLLARLAKSLHELLAERDFET